MFYVIIKTPSSQGKFKPLFRNEHNSYLDAAYELYQMRIENSDLCAVYEIRQNNKLLFKFSN